MGCVWCNLAGWLGSHCWYCVTKELHLQHLGMEMCWSLECHICLILQIYLHYMYKSGALKHVMLVVTCLCYPKCIPTECLTWLNDNCLLKVVGVVRWLDNGYVTLGLLTSVLIVAHGHMLGNTSQEMRWCYNPHWGHNSLPGKTWSHSWGGNPALVNSFSLCHPALAICLRYYNRFQRDNLFYYAVHLMTSSIVVFILCNTLPIVIHY